MSGKRLTDAERSEIIKLWATGKFSYGELGRKFQVTGKTVHATVDEVYRDRRNRQSRNPYGERNQASRAKLKTTPGMPKIPGPRSGGYA